MTNYQYLPFKDIVYFNYTAICPVTFLLAEKSLAGWEMPHPTHICLNHTVAKPPD